MQRTMLFHKSQALHRDYLVIRECYTDRLTCEFILFRLIIHRHVDSTRSDKIIGISSRQTFA